MSRHRILFVLTLTLACASPALTHAQPRFEIEGGLSNWSSYPSLYTPTPGVRVGVRLGDHAVLLTGVSASLLQAEKGLEGHSVSVPLELKLYRHPPQAGQVVPTLRLGAAASHEHTDARHYDADGALYSRNERSTKSLAAYALAGATYFPVEQFGISAELGARYTWGHTDTHDTQPPDQGTRDDYKQRSASALYRLALVYRF